MKGALSRWLFTSLGAIPVERGRGRAAMKSLEAADLRDSELLGKIVGGTVRPCENSI